MSRLKAVITDFDGTLVNTFEANFMAYREAFRDCRLTLSEEHYRKCFGLRFDRFMDASGIENIGIREAIREAKSKYYPGYFDRLKVNRPLLEFIRAFRLSGGKTAVASTARERNLMNALKHIGALDYFNLILAGESVSQGKPSPEIYLKAAEALEVAPEEVLVFEDSPVGFQAAEAAGMNYVAVTNVFF